MARHAISSLSSRIRRPAGFIEPCLPSPADKPPSGANWIHEIKHDGYRLMARRDPMGIRLLTRRGNDWSSRFETIPSSPILQAWWNTSAPSGCSRCSLKAHPMPAFAQDAGECRLANLDGLPPHVGTVQLQKI